MGARARSAAVRDAAAQPLVLRAGARVSRCTTRQAARPGCLAAALLLQCAAGQTCEALPRSRWQRLVACLCMCVCRGQGLSLGSSTCPAGELGLSDVAANRSSASPRQDEERVTARLRGADGAESTLTARWIVGCDGTKSAVRKGAGISFDGDTYPELVRALALCARV